MAFFYVYREIQGVTSSDIIIQSNLTQTQKEKKLIILSYILLLTFKIYRCVFHLE